MPSSASPPMVYAEEAEIPRGASISRYIVVGVLGRGGTGTVYRAYDAHLNRTLAIKILHRELATREFGEEVGARMQREAQAMARLNHPNVVVVHDVGMFDDRIFLAMEFVDGATLREWLQGEHSLHERLATVVAAGRGLAAAHAAGLVHRDFKPDNVLVGRDGRVRVTDFGLARLADETEHEARRSSKKTQAAEAIPYASPAATRIPSHAFAIPGESSLDALSSPQPSAPLTLTGSVLGTVGYMAPEQAFGEPTNAASDQFSFCVTLYFALYGRRPFAGDDLTSYFAAIQRPLPPPPTAPGGVTVPPWIHRILARGLSLDPHHRFPSMEALLDALEEDPETLFKKRRTFAIAAVLVAAAITLGILGLRRNEGGCAADPADLRGVWDDAARREVAASFAQTGAPAADDTAARVQKILDETAAKWTAMKTESCEATKVRHHQSDDDYKLRSECLERRRSELGALSSSLRVADKGVVDKAVAAAYGLTSVSFCADVPMLRKSGGLPDAPQARAQVIEARTELAKATSLELVGKVKESTGVAAHALTLARASGHESTVAEALRTMGGLEVEQNEYAEAERSLSEATWAASRVGADSLVVSGASITAFVVGSKLGRPGEARIWLNVADAALHRVGGSQELQLEYEEHKAWLLSDGDARPEETLPTQEHIAQAYQELYGVHPRTVRALYNLGDARTSSGDHLRACDAYARALAMAEAIGGESYSWTGYALEGRGDCLAAQGKFADGDDALARALKVFETNGDDYTQAEVAEVMIRSALAQGDVERAVKMARRTMEILKAQEDAASLLAIADVPVAEALMHVPPAPEAEPLCSEALREQEKLGQIDPTKTLRADALRCLGEARLLAGHPREALAPLERSVTLEHRTYPGDLARARFALARALVESGGDVAKAVTLAQQARDDFASAPGLGYELGMVQGWLAARK